MYRGYSEPSGASPGDTWVRVPESRPVIIDTDWWSDPDDVVSMRVAASAQRAGMIDIRAVTLNTSVATGPGSIDAFLRAEGVTGVPIGRTHTAHTPSGSNLFQGRLFSSGQSTGYQATCEDSVTLMRRVLAASDTKVDIIAEGFCNNLQDLLQSAADSVSGLTGMELVTAKVGTLWMSAGDWPSGTEYNFSTTTLAKTSGNYVMANWPSSVPIVLLDFECGEYVMTGGDLRLDYPTDQVWLALNDVSYPHGRKSWGAALVHIAALGSYENAGYTGTTGTGSVNSSTGANTWVSSSSGPHTYLTRSVSISEMERRLYEFVRPGATPEPSGETFVYSEGQWKALDPTERVQDASTSPGRVSRLTGTSYTTGLWCWLHASDLADLADNTAVPHWVDRCGNVPVYNATSGNRPVFRTSVGGKSTVQSAGSKWLYSDSVLMPREVTIYVMAYYATSVPAGASTFIACHDDADTVRGWHLKMASGVPTAVAFYNDSATYTDTTTAQSADAWHVLAMRSSPEQLRLEVFKDGVGSGSPTTISGTLNHVKTKMSVLSRYPGSASESVTGNVREIRVYDVWHNDATVAAVSAEMAA